MDHFAAKLLSVKEEDIQPIVRVAMNDLHFNPFSTENISSHGGDWKADSCFRDSLNIISFGNSKLSKPPNYNDHHVTKLEEAVSLSPVETISFSVDSLFAPSSLEEIYGGAVVGGMEYDEHTRTCGGGRTALQSQDHIKAERKRRQKLSESFIALSALVPGLKKLDKATVLDGAIKYLKELQERINILEDNRNTAAVSLCKRTRQKISGGDMNNASSSDEDFSGSQGHSSSAAPEIDVKISGEHVLLRVYCEKMDGMLKEILNQVENLNLSVTSTCAMPFGNTNLHIVVIAQMDDGFCMACHEIVDNIRDVVMKFM